MLSLFTGSIIVCYNPYKFLTLETSFSHFLAVKGQLNLPYNQPVMKNTKSNVPTSLINVLDKVAKERALKQLHKNSQLSQKTSAELRNTKTLLNVIALSKYNV